MKLAVSMRYAPVAMVPILAVALAAFCACGESSASNDMFLLLDVAPDTQQHFDVASCQQDSDCVAVCDDCRCSSLGICYGPVDQCASNCVGDLDCTSLDAALRCDRAASLCYLPSGACDGATACCGLGRYCVDIALAFDTSLTASWMAGAGLLDTFAFCSCDSAGACLGGLPCTKAHELCHEMPELCPDGAEPAGLPEGLCGTMSDLVAAFSKLGQALEAFPLAACKAVCHANADCHGPADQEDASCSWFGAPGRGLCFLGNARCGEGVCCVSGQCLDFQRILACAGTSGCPSTVSTAAGICACDDQHPCGVTPCVDLQPLCADPSLPNLCPGGIWPSDLPTHGCVDLSEWGLSGL